MCDKLEGRQDAISAGIGGVGRGVEKAFRLLVKLCSFRLNLVWI